MLSALRLASRASARSAVRSLAPPCVAHASTKSSRPVFDWADPLDVDALLGDEEKMVMVRYNLKFAHNPAASSEWRTPTAGVFVPAVVYSHREP